MHQKTPFCENYHAAKEDASLIEGLDAHPYMFMLESEDELSSGSSIPKHSRLHPTYKERKTRDKSLDYLDLQGTYPMTYSAKMKASHVPETPPPRSKVPVAESKPSPSSWAMEVEEQDLRDVAADQRLYTLEEITNKIIKTIFEELPFPDSAMEDLQLNVLIPKCIELNAKGCHLNDATAEKIVRHIVRALTRGPPDKTPCKAFATYACSVPPKNRKDVFEPH